MTKSTTRWSLPYPEGTNAADVPLYAKELATSLDDVAKDDQGPIASRPVSTVAEPGKKGRYYYATDTGVLYRDAGTSWVPINSNLGYGNLTPEQRGVAKAKIINTEEVIPKALGFRYAPTADKVEGITITEKTILFISYFGLWRGVGNENGIRATVFIGSLMPEILGSEGRHGAMAAAPELSSGSEWKPVFTHSGGMASIESTANQPALKTNGIILGGYADSSQGMSWSWAQSEAVGFKIQTDEEGTGRRFLAGPLCVCRLPAGTYDVGIKYGTQEGEAATTVKERQLYVWTKEFA